MWVPFNWQFFNFVHFTCLHDIVRYTHSEPEHANYTEHVVVIVEETRLVSEHHLSVVRTSQVFLGFKELGLFDMASVNFVHFPVVAIRMDHSCILDLGINLVHML